MNSGIETRLLDQARSLERPSTKAGRSALEGTSELERNEGTTPAGQSFGDFLKKNIESVNSEALEADEAMRKAVVGNQPNPHQALVAIQEAEMSFTLMIAIKDRLEQAYQQLIRTQL